MNVAAAESDDLENLVRSAQRGDTLAMHDLLDRLEPYVGRICGAIALDDGPDAAQETLIAVFRNLRHLHEPAALYGWVRAIATREAIRLARVQSVISTDEPDERASPGDTTLAEDIRDVLSRMVPEHRAILVLRDLEGLSVGEAAALLRVSDGTVKSRLHRARRSFPGSMGTMMVDREGVAPFDAPRLSDDIGPGDLPAARLDQIPAAARARGRISRYRRA